MDERTTQTVQTADRVSAFLWKVYGWMAVGLGLTAVVAFAVAGSPEIMRVLVGNRLVFFALVIAELGLAAYPLAFPQVTRLVTGVGPDDPEFRARYAKFLEALGAKLRAPRAERAGD